MTLLEQTGQGWKVWVFGVLLVLGSAATLLQGFLYAPLGRELAMQVAVAGMGMVVGAFVWAALGIRCPQCALKLFYHALRKQGFFSWFAWLLQAESCPGCGYGAAPRPPRPARRKARGLKRP